MSNQQQFFNKNQNSEPHIDHIEYNWLLAKKIILKRFPKVYNAIGYGSGVLPQEGYSYQNLKTSEINGKEK